MEKTISLVIEENILKCKGTCFDIIIALPPLLIAFDRTNNIVRVSFEIEREEHVYLAFFL